MFVFVSCIVSLLLLSQAFLAHARRDGAYIIGGSTAYPGEFPFQVSLQFNGAHICGASILSPIWILTAAHCVTHDPTVTSYQILAGTTTLNSGGVRRNLSQIVSNTGFRNVIIDDIALLRMADPLEWSNLIQPVVLTNVTSPAGTYVVLSGWGYVDQGRTQSTNDLRRINLRTITNDYCAQRTGGTTIPATDICTLTVQGEGFCQGDSGGALINAYTRQQVGIVCANYNPCARNYADIYTDVYSYLQWINTSMESSETAK